jgi:type IV pilus assembly protein PilC
MSLFHYKARTPEGSVSEGTRDAETEYALAHTLRAEGLTVLAVTPVSSSTQQKKLGDYLPNFLYPVSLQEKINFTRNIAVMIGAGLSLTKALEVMARQARHPRFHETILSMLETIKRGQSFADAVGQHPIIFPKYYQEMVRAGEKSGKLEESLKLVAMQLGKDYALRRKVKSALMYPSIIMVAMVGIGVLMMIYVVPTLVSTFRELNIDLPASTQFIIFISDSLIQSGFVLLIAVVVIGYGLMRFLKTTYGRNMMDFVSAKTPVLGKINQEFNAARTCRTLSSLISSGVDVLEALTITEGVIQNHLYRDVLGRARERIQKGETIAKSFLDAQSLYPPLVGEMMAVGEETGELSHMLLRLALFYENEVNAATKDLSTIIEPVLMILIGLAVGFFAVSMISPMYNIAGGIS